MDLCTVISLKLRLSQILFQEYHSISDFKAYFHQVYIYAKKYLEELLYEIPYLVTEKEILLVMSKWSSNWLTLTKEEEKEAGTSKTSQVTKGVKHENIVAKKDPYKVAIDVEKNSEQEIDCEVEHEEQASEEGD